MNDETTWEQREANRVAEARAWAAQNNRERDDRLEAQRQAADALNHERIKERDRLVRDMLNATTMREQTAATILAAMVSDRGAWLREHPGSAEASWTDAELASDAVALTDALRAELAKGGGDRG